MGKGLCFNFQGEVCVASLFFLPLCACADTHTHHTLSRVHLCFTDWLFTFSYDTGKSFTAPQPVSEPRHKLYCSCLDSLIPSCHPPARLEDTGSSARSLSGVQNVVPGCPQPPMAQHCPRVGDIGLVHTNVGAPMASPVSLRSDDVPLRVKAAQSEK